jgi:thiol-disulfide isomerase/thioredoxin
MTTDFRALFVLLAIANVAHADDARIVAGRVLDESGRPVADADVGYMWTANGSRKDKNGKPYDLSTDDGVKGFWGNVGKMEPCGPAVAKTGPDGRFLLNVDDRFHAVMSMDKASVHGGLAILPKGHGKTTVEIRIGRLVQVKGALTGPGAGRRPGWTFVDLMLPDDPTRPLDVTRLATCGSFEARFMISLPPGRYVVHGKNDEELDKIEAETTPEKEIFLTGKTPVVDLGVMLLSPSKASVRMMKERAKVAGTWGDYTKHYGEQAPPWHVVDARGVKKNAQISDFRGKWVLVDFWGLSCNACLRTGLPKLMKFYEKHQAHRDRFEIISICIDVDGELKSIADLDKKLRPIIEHVWGKPLPFPVLLDPTFTTWERYGLPGFPTVILIDPEGNLVTGDETVLAEKLTAR